MRTLCSAYVELFRNVPLLLQLFIWYFILTEIAAADRRGAAAAAGDVFFSKNGLQFPMPAVGDGHIWSRVVGFGLGLPARGSGRDGRARHFEATGVAPPVLLPALALIVGAALLGWLVGGAPTARSTFRRRPRSTSSAAAR